jgi:hypothetical protein
MTRCLVLACLLAVAPVAAGAQPPPPPPPPPSGMGGGITTISAGVAQGVEAPAFGTAAISGIVTDGVTGAPVAGALVSLVGTNPGGQAAQRPRQMTDGRGRYIFTHLPAGGYTVSAIAPGYLDGGYRRLPGVTLGVRINVDDGEWFAEAHTQLWKPASVSGLISDERGEPLVGIPVRVLTRIHVGGAARWVAGPTVTTDDRGEYRIPGLRAGDYVVHVPSVQVTLPNGHIALYSAPQQRSTSTGAAAPVRTGQPPDIVRGADGTGVVVGHYATPDGAAVGRAYPMMFHPAARTLDVAEVVQLTFGDERRNVDVQVRPVPTVSVSGRVVGPVEAIVNLPVRLVPRGSEGMGAGAEAGVTATDTQGAFTFHLVPDGDYTILASRSVSEYSMGGNVVTPTVIPSVANPFNNRSSSMQVAGGNQVTLISRGGAGVQATGRASISVGNQSIAGLTIPLSPSVSVSGHFEWDGSPSPPESQQFTPMVRLEPADGDIALGTYFSSPQQRAPAGEPQARVTFTIENVLPGQYVLSRILAGAEWALAAAEWNGRDVLTTPLQVEGNANVEGLVIRMTTQNNSLTGTVRDGVGAITTDGRVIAFPAAPTAWRQGGVSGVRFGNASILADGTYSLPMLLPGDYYLAAIPNEDRQRASDPDFLASLAPQATRITVTLSSALTQDLRIIGGGR